MQDGASTLMSIRDAAQATGLSPKALRRRIERGTLTSVMIGGRRRIPMEALARRGLIAPEHHAIGAHRLADLTAAISPVLEDRLRRLESRVSALEEVLAGQRSGEATRRAHGDGSPGDGASADPGSSDGGGASTAGELASAGAGAWTVAMAAGAGAPREDRDPT